MSSSEEDEDVPGSDSDEDDGSEEAVLKKYFRGRVQRMATIAKKAQTRLEDAGINCELS